jgi:hypothetical protein
MTTRKYSFINKSGEVYPAFGCGRLAEVLEVDSAGSQPIYKLVKPDGEDGLYVVNGPNNVANDKPGVGLSITDAFLVLTDDGSTDDAPGFGDVCGPTLDRWAATTGGTGLRASGEVANRVIPVVPMGGGGTGAHSIMFRIIRVLRGVGLNCNAMECEVLNASCGSGVSAGDIETVYDEIGCVFNAPEHLLYDRRGYAIQMKNFAYRIHDPLIFEPGTESIAAPTGSCRWAAQNLCCVEEDS